MTQIFIEPELENLSDADNAAQWFDICTELGLTKQLDFADKSEEKKAPPYMAIDPKTNKVIATLCPMVTDYKNYNVSTIPLDVLQEIQKCEKNGWYAAIKIAYDNKSPDPFVLGFTKSESNWDRHIHLIARWGAELLPFEMLEYKAIQRVKEDVMECLSSLKNAVDFGISNIDLFSKQILAGKPELNLGYRPNELSTWI